MSTPVVDEFAAQHHSRGVTLGEHIRRLREAKGWTLEELSTRSGVDIGTISALEVRKSRRSQFAPQLAEAFGISTDALLAGHTGHPANERLQPFMVPVQAQRVSQFGRIVDLPRFTWGEIVTGSGLGELFIAAMEDDANAPDFPRGADVIWSTGKRPAIGSLVLVRDRAGALHARELRQGRSPDQWLAVPANRAFRTLDSVEDGLQVVAVAAFKALP